MTTIKETLTRAKELINEKGWAKGAYQDSDGCLCALGAVRAASHPEGHVYELSSLSDEQYELMWESASHLAKFVPILGALVHEFNDHPDVTKEDVLDLFDRAIEAAA